MKKIFSLLLVALCAMQVSALSFWCVKETEWRSKKSTYRYSCTVNEDGKTVAITSAEFVSRDGDALHLGFPDTVEYNGVQYVVTDIGNPRNNDDPNLRGVGIWPDIAVSLPKTIRHINNCAFRCPLHRSTTFDFQGAEVDFIHPNSGITRNLGNFFLNLTFGRDFHFEKTATIIYDDYQQPYTTLVESNFPFDYCSNLHVSPECVNYEERNGCLYRRGVADTILTVLVYNGDTAVISKQVKCIAYPATGGTWRRSVAKRTVVRFENGSRLERLGISALGNAQLDSLPATLRYIGEGALEKSCIERQPRHADTICTNAFKSVIFPNDKVLIVPPNAVYVAKGAFDKLNDQTMISRPESDVTDFPKIHRIIWSKNSACSFTGQNLADVQEVVMNSPDIIEEKCLAQFPALTRVYLNRPTPPVIAPQDRTRNAHFAVCATGTVPLLMVPKGCREVYNDWWSSPDLDELDFSQWTSVSEPESARPDVRTEEGTLTINGGDIAMTFAVYDTQGRLVARGDCRPHDTVRLELPGGLYLIVVGQQRLKVYLY